MTLASTYIPHSPRNLQACCDCCGVRLEDAHTALADARATTQLLARYIGADDDFADRWAHCYAQSLHVEWPALAADPGCVKPRGAAPFEGAADTYVGRLAAHLAAVGGTGGTDSYLEVLDRALIDRILALHEMDELISLARDLGLSREQTDAAHRDYLDALVRQAWVDGKAADAEDRRPRRHRRVARHRRAGTARVHPDRGGQSGRPGRLRLQPACSPPSPSSPTTVSSSRERRMHRTASSCAQRRSRWACGRCLPSAARPRWSWRPTRTPSAARHARRESAACPSSTSPPTSGSPTACRSSSGSSAVGAPLRLRTCSLRRVTPADPAAAPVGA